METGNEEDIVIEEENTGSQELVKKLREKLKKCETEKSEYLSGWQRTKADFINARKEEEERRAEFLKFSEENLIQEILVFADSLDRLFKNEKELSELDKSWRDGIKNLRAQLANILKGKGAEPFESEGEEFNPEKHECLGEVRVDDKTKSGIVIEEVRKGYGMRGKIIRPAQVRVGKAVTSY